MLGVPNLIQKNSSIGMHADPRARNENTRLRDFNQLHQQYQMVNKQDKIKGFDKRKNSSPYLVIIQGI